MTLTYHFLLSVLGVFGETHAKNNDLKPTTNMGKEFYLIVPPTLKKFDATRNTPSLEFHFYGFEGRLKVTLTTNKKIFYRNRNNANVNEIDRFISVDRDDVARIILACSLEGTCHVGVTEQTSWTFRVRGENSFGIYVHYLVSKFSVAIFTPVPVEAWGKKYFAVTLGSDHFIGLVAGKVSVSVVVTFRLEAEYENIVLKGGTYYNNKMAKISIEKQEAFIVSTCKNSKYIGHITGTSFVGSVKFGVISGSCNSGTMTTSCYGSEEQKIGSKDMAVEMLIPSESFGRHFIVFSLEGRKTVSYYLITASQDHTVVNIRLAAQSKVLPEVTLNERDTKKYNLLNAYVASSKGVQVAIVQASACIGAQKSDKDVGDPSLCILVPMGLFFNKYVWRIDPEQFSYFAVVIQWEQREAILFDGTALFDRANVKWVNVTARNKMLWSIGHYKFMDDKITKHVLISGMNVFGCYFYGYTPVSGYMYPGGYIVSPINLPCNSDSTVAVPSGDLIDNDCDGLVDEEAIDGEDNDRDRKIDEDTNKYKTELHYGHWSDWACSRDCYDTKLYRYRECRSNNVKVTCQGNSNETKPSECYFNEKCPETCPAHEWGVDCKHTCDTCVKDCDKFTGACDQCKPGFQDPAHSCKTPVGGPGKSKGNNNVIYDWNEWHCSQDCRDTSQVRERICKSAKSGLQMSNCSETSNETRPAECYADKNCPELCPNFKWGINCVNSCENCEEPCNKFIGVCQTCNPGFQKPSNSCSIACSFNRYGINCRGSCIEKCGEDCIERVHGDCPGGGSGLGIGVLILFLLFAIVGIYIGLIFHRMKLTKKAVGAGAGTPSVMSMPVSQMSVQSEKSAATEKSERSKTSNKSDKSKTSNRSDKVASEPSGSVFNETTSDDMA